MKYFVAGILFLAPCAVQGAGPHTNGIGVGAGPTYASIAEVGQNEFTLRVQTLGSESRMHCILATFSCSAMDNNFVLTQTASTTGPVSPDGRYVVYYTPATQTRTTRTFYIFDTLTSTMYAREERGVTYWDLLSEGPRIFAFSPDSSKLLYISDAGGYAVPHIVELAKMRGGTFVGTPVITKKYTVSDFGWLDNDTIYFTANRTNPLQWDLFSYVLSTGALRTIDSSVSYPVRIPQVGGGLLYIAQVGNTAVPRYYDKTTKQVRNFTLPGFTNSSTLQTELVKHAGLTGVYWKPALPSKTLLVWLHGGPYRQTSIGYHSHFSYAGYDWVLEEATKAGAGVLRLDYPGSFGYGRKAAEAISRNIGTKDVTESDAAIRAFAKARGYTDIYLVGNSYGGYLAPKILVEKPQTYKGAFAINGVWDWSSLTYQLNTSIFNVQFNGVESSTNEHLYRAAALFDRLPTLGQQKVVIAHGDSDATIPYTQSKDAYEIFRLGGKNATFLTFAGEDHVFRKKESFETLCRAVLEFSGVSATTRCALP